MSKDQIKKEDVAAALKSVGAGWAHTDTKTVGVRMRVAAYHVHPNAADPQQQHILTFGSLQSVLDWCEEVRDEAQ
jgi:hypothetical protein